MAITLQLKPEIEARLISEAAQQGVSPEIYLASWIEKQFSAQTPNTENNLSDAEWEATLLEFVNSPSFQNSPPLSDQAISREAIYTSEDEIR
ncbi:hypothetical protein ACQ4M3_21405 [Leptolyngbya sp. AN03gr2]|uniref:hypothetical protein n=1 Tax=unclassified Leptolyngbya TaxID=2650499 RepID=UPI003D31F9CA